MSEIHDSENWRPVVGYEDRYLVSDLGRVFKIATHRMMKQCRIGGRGYCRVGFGYRDNQKHFRVHRLVMEAFVGPCPIGKEVNHINAIRHDNRLVNLEYVTHHENVRHCVSMGRHRGGFQAGERHGNARWTDDDIRRIRAMFAAGASLTELSKTFAASKGSMHRIAHRDGWKHIE